MTQKQYRDIMGYLPRQTSGQEEDELPIVDISHEEATFFCEMLTKKKSPLIINGLTYVYRLPTEAEWEYCCRAGAVGYRPKNITQLAWFNENSDRKLKPVMQKNLMSGESTICLVMPVSGVMIGMVNIQANQR